MRVVGTAAAPGQTHFNPSVVRFRGRLLVAYNFAEGWAFHQIRVAELDDHLAISSDRLIDLSAFGQPHTEDMRLFVHDDALHGLYFEGVIAKPDSGMVLVRFDDQLNVVDRFLPRFGEKVRGDEKNWQFFSHAGELLCVYQIDPHVVLKKNGGTMEQVAETARPLPWRMRRPCGGTPPIEFEGEYLSFFHSHTNWPGKELGWPRRIYHAGAYTFDKAAPFAVRRMTADPLMTAPTHDADPRWPATVFPCGAVRHQDKILVTYGYHDQRPRLALYDPAVLSKRLQPVKDRRPVPPSIARTSGWRTSLNS